METEDRTGQEGCSESIWKKADRWSRTHRMCAGCHSTERAHAGGGLCKRCYERSNFCSECGTPVHKTSQRCSPCAAKNRVLERFEEDLRGISISSLRFQ